jgi:serine/threonine protein kinase
MKGYGPEVDWWSLGVIIFEMLVGYAPFSSEKPTDTCKKILNHKQTLKFPDDVKLSIEAKDLITSLIADLDTRLGYNGSEEIKRHPFFKNIDFKNIRNIKAPFIPDVIKLIINI